MSSSAKTALIWMLWLLNWNFPVRVVYGFDLSKTPARTNRNFALDTSRGRTSSSTSLEAGDPNNVVATRPTTTTKPGIDENLLRQLNSCETGTSARRVLEKALSLDNVGESTERPLFGSIQVPAGLSDKIISDGDLAIQTKVRNKKYGIFDLIDTNGDRDADRIAAAVFGVFVGSSLSAIAVNENLPGPEILRFTIVWLLSFAPLGLVGFGIGNAEQLQAFLVTVQRQIFPVYRQRMVQHEAGHFLMAHLLGYPIAGYSTNAVKNAVEFYPLNDKDAGRDKAQTLGFDRQISRVDDDATAERRRPRTNDAPFFSPDGSGAVELETQSVFRNAKNYTNNPFLKIATENQPRNSWPYRGFDHSTIDKLAVVSVAGVCSEIMAFGYAEGGLADFSQLQQFFANAEPELTDRDKENRIRFAMGYTMTQLRLHLGCLDTLAAAMDRGASVAECVSVIESCTNVRGGNGIFGDDYELSRRKEMKSSLMIFEKLFLSPKDVDAEEDRMVQGAGGGYIEEKPKFIQITGDDPIYLAGGVACLFLAYAASGGISLH